ncbi:hypothetical protein IFM89_018162, partial [Coptis chinensis]
DDVEESEDDKKVDVGDCLEETESDATSLDHISEDDEELIEVRKINMEIKYKKKKSSTKEVDEVLDEPHEQASEAATEQASEVANELPNLEMDTGGAGENESDYATSDDYLSPESSEEEDEDVASIKERKRKSKVKKRMYPIFNLNVEMSNIQIKFGMRSGNVRKRGKKAASTTVEKPGSSKKGKEVAETTKKGKEKGEGTPTVSKKGKRIASTTVEKHQRKGVGASKRKTIVKGRKDHVPKGVEVFTAESGNSYLKSNQVSSEAQIPSSQGSITVSKQVSKTSTTASAQASTTTSKQSLTTDTVESNSKPRNSPSKAKQKIIALTVRTIANSKPKTRSTTAKAKTKGWK